MSEFTSGHLILNKNFELVAENCSFNIIKKKINHKWSAFFIEDIYLNESPPSYIMSLSEKFPILYFFIEDLTCWGFKIISEGSVISSFYMNNQLDYSLVLERFNEMFPDIESPEEYLYMTAEGKEVFDKLYKETIHSESYLYEFKEQFSGFNSVALDLFNVSDGVKSYLDSILTPENYHKSPDPLKEFITRMDIMEVISFNYNSAYELP